MSDSGSNMQVKAGLVYNEIYRSATLYKFRCITTRLGQESQPRARCREGLEGGAKVSPASHHHPSQARGGEVICLLDLQAELFTLS